MVQSEKRCLMAWAKDKAVLRKSSSGGIFSVLAEYVLSNNGAIIGAAITNYETKTLEHICITTRVSTIRVQLEMHIAKQKNYLKQVNWCCLAERLARLQDYCRFWM